MTFFWEQQPKKPFLKRDLEEDEIEGDGEGNNDSTPAASDSMPTPIDVASARLNQMSLEERSHALYDLHGVADDIEETPEFLDRKYRELGSALLSCLASEKPDDTYAFRTALRLSKDYVDGLKLRFLRSDMYRGDLAANRMIQFFSRKLDLFGEDLLVQDIQQKHLTEEDLKALRSGFVQLLPQRDRAGRAVLLVHGKANVSNPNTKSVIRTLFYFTMAALKDEETQKKRMVGIYYGIGQEKTIPGRVYEYFKAMTAVPWGAVGFHYCKDDIVLGAAVKFLGKALENKILGRARFHGGSHMEVLYKLVTFGIPRDALPMKDDGNLDLSSHHRMLQAIKSREERTDPTGGVGTSQTSEACSQDASPNGKTAATTSDTAGNNSTLVPGPMDIIMGRGRRPKSQLGAMKMHSLLLQHRDAYDVGAKWEKTMVSELILKELKKSKCRFLTRTPDGYVECDDAAARDKISHGFRNLRIKTSKEENNSKRRETSVKKRTLVETAS